MKRPLKVLQVGMTRILGGLETYLIEQYRHIDSKKLHYDFVNITGEYEICYAEEIRSKGSQIFSVPSRHKNPLGHYWGWIKILFKHRGYDAIVLNTNSLEYVFPLFIGKIFNIPLRVIHSHNSGFENKQGLIRKTLVIVNDKLLDWSANLYFACSKKAGQWMFKNKPFHVIYNGIDCDPYRFNEVERRQMRSDLGLAIRDFAVLHVGRFSYQKNHKFLVDIFKKIIDKEPNTKLLLIGDTTEETTELKELRLKIKQLGLTENILFLGRRNDVHMIMKACDILIMPSLFEGLGIVAIEAQAANLPVCMSDVAAEELAISDTIEFISLASSAEEWADRAIKWKDYRRHDAYDVIKNSGFDIYSEVHRVEKLYEESVKDLER